MDYTTAMTALEIHRARSAGCERLLRSLFNILAEAKLNLDTTEDGASSGEGQGGGGDEHPNYIMPSMAAFPSYCAA